MIKYKEVVELEDIRILWNQEFGFIYPITKAVFKQNIIDYQNLKAFGAYDESQLVGFIICKDNITNIESYKNLGWISLFMVAKPYRRQGIGSVLLHSAETYFKDKSEILIGRDVFNFFPGVPIDFNNLSDSWLIRRGYIDGGYTHDVVNTHLKKMELRNNKFRYQICTLKEKDALLGFMKNNFPGRWYYEASDYFANGGNGNEYAICLDNDKVIAFARTNDRSFKHIHYNTTWYDRFNNLGGIGPLGVDKTYRGQDLGFDIVAYANNALLSRGITEIIIDWTGLLEFYRQFGFEVFKSYKYLSKKG